MEICLFVDHDCNLRCRYCYNGKKLQRKMSHSTAERAVDFALARDPTGIGLSFFGGEPLLCIDLIEHATAYAKQRLAAASIPAERLRVYLTTNATLVDARFEDFVRRHTGMSVFVSIDGPAHVHDRYRVRSDGYGSHADVRAGIFRLASAGANVVALTVTNPDTACAMGDVVAELCSLPIVRAQITCNLHVPWDATALDALREGTMAGARVWGQQFRAGRCVHLDPFVMKILSHLHGDTPCPSRCQMEAHECIVAPTGRIYGCGELIGEDDDDRFVIGDVASGIWWDKLKRLRDAKNRITETCKPCVLSSRCTSNCGCKQVALTGTYGQVTDAFCAMEEAFIAAADTIAEELHHENCQSFRQFFYEQPWVPNTPEGLAQLRRSR